MEDTKESRTCRRLLPAKEFLLPRLRARTTSPISYYRSDPPVIKKRWTWCLAHVMYLASSQNLRSSQNSTLILVHNDLAGEDSSRRTQIANRHQASFLHNMSLGLPLFPRCHAFPIERPAIWHIFIPSILLQ